MSKMYSNVVARTVYSRMTVGVSRRLMRLLGWRWEGEVPALDKYVVIAAPHSTNWDLLFMLLGVRSLDMASVFMMKDTVYWWPLGSLWRWLGGIPVNRRASANIIRQAVEYFETNEKLRLVITPEGTRKKVEHWKLGFYWIALGANVPILLGYVDYKNKITGVGPLFYPTGDVAADFEELRAFYEPTVGVSPTCRVRPGEVERMMRSLGREMPGTPPNTTPDSPTLS